MKKESIWKQIDQKKVCPKLDKNITVDVLIVGGGITGISTAYHLKDSNLNICLVEKNTIASGVTSRTTGKLTYLQETIYSKLKSYHGIETAKQYYLSQKEAIEIVKNIINTNKIDCNFEQVSSYVFTNSNDKKLDDEINLLKTFNILVKEANTIPTIKNVSKACYVEDTYVFHPLKYLLALKDICLNNNISIFENTTILDIEKKGEYFWCKTDNNLIKAKYVVFASHYPYFIIPYLMPLKTYIEKSYIEAYKVDKNDKFSAINIDKPTISVRYHADGSDIYKLYLTNSHNTCIKNNDKDNFNKLLKSERKNPEYLWSNHDIITNDSLPFIGALNNEKTFLIGTGYNTWGMTNGSLAGMIIADIILKKKSKYESLFDPLRGINWGKILSFPLIVGSNAYSFVKSKLKKDKKWYSSNIKFTKKDGIDIAIYTDEDRNEHVVVNKCPHLKCGLVFNETEKTWDCPCHGSRFDIDGNSIEGPSNYDIKYKK